LDERRRRLLIARRPSGNMGGMQNRQVRLAARPEGLPSPTDWSFTEEPAPTPKDGEVLVRILYVSLDPAMRTWMNAGTRSYMPRVEIGDVMRAGTVGRVVESRSPRFKPGDCVYGALGVQLYATAKAHHLEKVDAEAAPLPCYLGTLGMTGLTAYFGLLDVGRPQPGDTIVVSAAAGAVGMVAGQIARIGGARVIGIAGGADKCRWITGELGFHAAIDYKADDLKGALEQHCPHGVDVYFDNVGGPVLDAVLGRLARGARVVLSGAISQYNAGAMAGPAKYMSLLVNRASMAGFVVFDYEKRFDEARRRIAAWMAAGQLRSREEVVEGIDAFPATLNKLFRGENTGKLVLKVAGE
jgi:NADPH-dependent curcumin reductase CurA